MNELTMHELSRAAEMLNADGLRLLINTAKSLSLSSKYRADGIKLNFDKEVDKVLTMVCRGVRKQ